MAENPYSQMVLDGTMMMLDCKWLGLKYQVYENGLKNLMERLFVQQIKDRTDV
jgi:hypothetical protein